MPARLIAVLASVAFLAACSSSSTTGTDGSPSPSPSPLTEAELSALLLAQIDMPAGYTETPQDPSAAEEDENFCDAVPPAEPAAKASVDFQASETGPFVNESLESYAAGRAEAVFTDFLGVLEGCTAWTTTLEGSEITFAVEQPEHEQVGDQSVAVRATFDGPVTITSDAIGFRQGDVLAIVAHTTLDGSTDPETLRSLAAKAAAKIAAG